MLGLYQLSFVHFLLFSELEGLHFWVGFTDVLCHAEALSRERPEVFAKAARVVFNMLKQMPKDFFYDNITKDNFLRSGVTHLMEILEGFRDPRLHALFDRLLKGNANADFFGFEYREIVQYAEGGFGKNNVRGHCDDEMPQVLSEEDLKTFSF